ncbi:(d)CMP kinase [Rubrivirga sp. IMCC45206]|uniref:(d)CMP kinase n=1 Tax=Rubrivirga sp. IMCC45206 TaxID=3391614 RepID=UPI00398FF89B
MIVAIDGPAGSGKSTTARQVADRLGWLYLDTGAMYRAVGLAFRERSLPFTETAAAALVDTLDVALRPGPDGTRVALDGDDVTARIRTPEAAVDASQASALGPVRAAMVALQRRAAADYVASHGGGVVVEGRDIGTVVFPDADVKFFLVADLDARAARRLADFGGPDGADAAFDTVRAELAARDARDEGRAIAPLRAAPDAVTLDTTTLDIDQQVEHVLHAVRRATTSPAA